MNRVLSACRFLLVIPVVGCLLLTAGVVVMGAGRIVTGTGATLAKGDFSPKASKAVALAVLETIDLFLVGTVAYITAIGIYKLFIKGSEIEMPTRLKINNLKDLEDKILGVVVAALAVAFLGQVASASEPTALLNYGGGIALVIAALAWFIRQPSGKPPTE
ncbi:MAG: YqhA family protein [Deltaproteobacteria bacterium]|nr:YqhA family protein [Deltaproteobacteria bacterium]